MTPDNEKEISVFRPHQPGIRKLLGDLEADIMDTVWGAGPDAKLTVRDVHTELQSKRGAAYTTVMTVMGILAKKGLLTVEKSGMAHQYSATQTREAFTEQAIGKVLDGLLQDFTEPALAHLAKGLQGVDAKRLARLKALLKKHAPVQD